MWWWRRDEAGTRGALDGGSVESCSPGASALSVLTRRALWVLFRVGLGRSVVPPAHPGLRSGVSGARRSAPKRLRSPRASAWSDQSAAPTPKPPSSLAPAGPAASAAAARRRGRGGVTCALALAVLLHSPVTPGCGLECRECDSLPPTRLRSPRTSVWSDQSY